jgi:import inner membrane translocase subunit TIM21
MIRSAFLRRPAIQIQSQTSRRGASLMLFHSKSTSGKQTPSLLYPTSLLTKSHQLNSLQHVQNQHSIILRSTSSTSSKKQPTNDTTSQSEQESSEIVLTPGEKVVVGSRLLFWAAALSFAAVCAYYIGKELLPTKMSPNTVFDKATSLLRNHEEITRRFGNFKTYGRDHGGHREGRRNFIEHTEYTAEDGSKRTRVRFNLEGQYGNAFVFAEVSKEMDAGDFVYVLVQDKRNGQVISVVDNRSVLLARRLAGGDKEGENVFANLLGGGKK